MGVVNKEQVEYWNSAMGDKWVENQRQLDRCFSRITRRLIEVAAPVAGEHIMDVGCGAGETSIALAGMVGSSGEVLGVDISRALLDLAGARTAGKQADNVQYLMADAQVHQFTADHYDLVFSRFGVMFFDDPVEAFRNLTGAVKPGGRVVFAAWAKAEQNPWFRIPGQLAIDQLGAPAPVDPHAPGPMAFADADRVANILRTAGLVNVDVKRESLPLVVDGSASDAAELACNLGVAARLMKEKGGSVEDFRAICHSVAMAFGTWQKKSTVEVPATILFYSGNRENR